MAEKGKSKKPRYEPPIVVPLGEVAKGSGECDVGSGNASAFNCTTGNLVLGTCDAGLTPTSCGFGSTPA